MSKLNAVIRHELALLFATPAAYLFLGMFLGLSLFAVFWLEAFFARNLADLRPLFDSLPTLLLLLIAALSMRAWAEEHRSGTAESLLSAPVPALSLVLGKFLALLLLTSLALLLTAPLALTVAQLGALDWGPVLGGYLAAFSLAAAYIAIGLYFSARSNNPLISFILTAVSCAAFTFIGSAVLTDLVSAEQGHWLRQISALAHYNGLARGVLELTDIAFFALVTLAFLMLNLLAVLRLRAPNTPRWQAAAITGLILANLAASPFSLQTLPTARADLTDGQLYSLSATTRDLLQSLNEPLRIYAYFSQRTHPLLAPLQPQLGDLLREYQAAAGNKVSLQIIDPSQSRAAENQAAERFGITPVPFQTSSRYQSGITNAYFNIVLAYGDRFEVLDYEDLIDIALRGETDVDVRLRNPEYDITRALRRAVQSYRTGTDLFERVGAPVTLHAYLSPENQLPPPLAELRKTLLAQLTTLEQQSQGRFSSRIEDPDANNGRLAQQLRDEHGFRPMTTSPTDPARFWFYLLLESTGRKVPVTLPGDLTAESLQRNLLAGLQRLTQGTLKTIAVHAPPPGDPRLAQFGLSSGPNFQHLRDALAESANLINTDFNNGRVPEQADLLLLLAPEAITAEQLFAIDQFLMRGGIVIAGTAPTTVELQGQLGARAHDSGLEGWLTHLGIQISERFVLDQRNADFPIPVQRRVGDQSIQEFQRIPYAFFIDVRADGLTSPSTASLEQLTLSWMAAINSERAMRPLVQSSTQSGLAQDAYMQPDFQQYPELGFQAPEPFARQTLVAEFNGPFASYFRTRPAPEPLVKHGVLEQAAPSARLILLASNTTLTDDALDLATAGLGSEYRQPVRLIQNLIDHTLEDPALLALRSRSYRAQTLPPLTPAAQRRWEYLNYAAAALSLLIIWALARWRRQRRLREYLA